MSNLCILDTLVHSFTAAGSCRCSFSYSVVIDNGLGIITHCKKDMSFKVC
jgi:hypothetical protein